MLALGWLVFILGSAVGSFLNVVIDRGPQGRTALGGRSSCDFCHTPLLWWELIPVLGFFLVGCRCRTCHQKLSWQYPLVEAATGVLFVVLFLYLFLLSSHSSLSSLPLSSPLPSPPPLPLPYQPLASLNHPLTALLTADFWIHYFFWGILLSGLLALAITDLKYGLLPDAVVGPLVLWVLLGRLGGLGRWGTSVLVGLAIAGFFAFLIWLTHGRGMGWGDVKLGFLLGVIGGWPTAVVGLFISFLTGALAGIILILAGKKSLKETLPFGPFLILGAVVGLVFGQRIFDWYWRML